MSDAGFGPPAERARIGWWLYVLVLAVAAAFLAYSFVGLIALGVFGYYATRPVCRRLERVVDSDGVAAGLTVTVVLLPVVLLILYAGVRVVSRVGQFLDGGQGSQLPGNVLGALPADQRETVLSAVRNPRQVLANPESLVRPVLETGLQAVSGIFGAVLLLALAVTLSYFLLKNDGELADGLRELFGGRDTTAYAYATAVDDDLESVFFGNFLFVVVMAAVATAVYWATDVVAPQGLDVPMVLVLGFLTGVASLIPIVVGKVIYLPVVGFLGFQAMGAGGGQLVFVGGVLVVYFLVLDVLPQTFLQPYITGRQLDVVVLLFAYLLGPVLFGWYGFFFLPIVFVLILETVRIVLPELVHGERVRPGVELGDSVGADPDATVERAGSTAEEPGSTAEGTGSTAGGDDSTTGDGPGATGE